MTRDRIGHRLKFNSALAYAQKIELVPGLKAEITCAPGFSVRARIEDPPRFAEHLAHDHRILHPSDLNAAASELDIDLDQLEAAYGRLLPVLRPHLPGYASFQNAIDEIPLIVVAGAEFNAEARKEGIICLHAGLIRRMEAFVHVAIAMMNLGDLPSFRTDPLSLFEWILAVLREVVSTGGTGVAYDAYTSLTMDIDGCDPANSYLPAKRGLWTRFILFVIAHEYGHIVLRHHHGSLLLGIFGGSTPRRVSQEIEADLFAAEALNGLTRSVGEFAPGDSGRPFAYQVAVMLYCLSVAMEDAPVFTSPEEMHSWEREGEYPHSLQRLLAVYERLCPNEDMNEPSHPLCRNLEHILTFHRFVVAHPVSQQ